MKSRLTLIKLSILHSRTDILGRIFMGSGEVLPEKCVKFLGILIDGNINFRKHIEYLMGKMSKNIGILNKVKYFLPPFIMRTLYYTLIEPYVKYGIEVWGGAPASYLGRVHVAQKGAVRAINGLPYTAHTADYFKHCQIFSVFVLYKYEVLLLMYKVINYNLYPFMFNSTIRHTQIHSHQTRNSNSIVLPLYNLSNSQRNASYNGPKYWNELYEHLRDSSSFKLFKRELKKFMFV